jgi:hypothetical protein
VLGGDASLGKPLDLAFTEHGHGFITLDGSLGGGERPTPQPRIDAAFHTSMILLHHIIQILALPEPTGFRGRPRELKGPEG